jgi:hypothetical protein
MRCYNPNFRYFSRVTAPGMRGLFGFSGWWDESWPVPPTTREIFMRTA